MTSPGGEARALRGKGVGGIWLANGEFGAREKGRTAVVQGGAEPREDWVPPEALGLVGSLFGGGKPDPRGARLGTHSAREATIDPELLLLLCVCVCV